MGKTTGERIREMRAARDVGATELARKVGVSANYIHKLESGRNAGTSDVLAKIAKELQTTVDYLLGGTVGEDGIPLPEPEIAALVARLNRMTPDHRRQVSLAINAVLTYGEYISGAQVEGTARDERRGSARTREWIHRLDNLTDEQFADFRRWFEDAMSQPTKPARPGQATYPDPRSGDSQRDR